MANKKIIELDAASQINSDALFAVSQQVSSEQKTLKGTVEQVGDYIAGQQTFSSLNTTSKKLIGAINEAVSGIETALITPVPLASFADGGKNIPLKALKVLVTAVQAGTGTPSPSNVRAISGWSGANVDSISANLWSEEWELGNYNSSTGAKSTDNNRIRSTNKIRIKPNTNYFLVAPNSSAVGGIYFYDKNEDYIGFIYTSPDYVNGQFTTPSNAYYLTFAMPQSYGTTYGNNISLNYPSTDTTYHAYNGTTHNIPFNTTVYGGMLDVLSGVLTVTHGYETISSGTGFNMQAQGAYIFKTGLSPAKLDNDPTQISNMFTQNQTTTNWGVFKVASNGTLFFGNYEIGGTTKHFADVSAFDTWVSSNNIQVCYELATPTTIQLTPTEVKTILGQNNIFGDCGDIDTLIYFNNNANEISDLVVAYVGDITNLYATLATGNTSVTITNPAIKTNSTIDIYCDPDTLHNSVTVTDGQIVITFDAQASDVKVKVRVS